MFVNPDVLQFTSNYEKYSEGTRLKLNDEMLELRVTRFIMSHVGY